ncbi:MAG: glycosyltransferase family 4 protein [Betaproteobacteria bacterium]
MTHYRLPFFEALRKVFDERGCRLDVAYGDGTPEEARKGDGGELSWGLRLPTRYLAGGRLCWQPFYGPLAGADLVVVTAENKLICNLPVQLLTRHARVALWGHGGNLQGDPHSWRERFKRLVALRADWWFGYTEFSRPLILATGFPADRVTTLNNAVDTGEMAAQRLAVTIEATEALRRKWGLGTGPVGIFVGSLYGEKRIGFMLAAAEQVQIRIPDFQFVIVGTGPDQALVTAFCERHAWAHAAGLLKGQQKADAMSLARVMLNPGLVGLGILDSFVCGVPMVTTDCGLHSPEIAYLANGRNGLMTPDTADAFVDAVVTLLQDDVRHADLVRGCRDSAAEYTVENMARRFADGAQACLASAPRRFE